MSPQTHVDIIGYGGSRPHEALHTHPRIRQHHIAPFPAWFPRAGPLFAVFALCKIAFQVAQLLWTLGVGIDRPDCILVQNPPAVPTLAVVRWVCWLRRCRLVIDWHNLGFTILALSKGGGHWSVKLSRWYERCFGRQAHAHLCVTKAMSSFLAQQWGISATVLYDRPPQMFRRQTLPEQHELFLRLEQQSGPSSLSALYDRFGIANPSTTSSSSPSASSPSSSSSSSSSASAAASLSSSTTSSTLFTECRDGRTVASRPNRPALLISSTSWTEDEDFGILLEAILQLDAWITRTGGRVSDGGGEGNSGHDEEDDDESEKKDDGLLNSTQLKLVFIITGKGPQKQMYEERIAQLTLQHCAVLTMWLAAEDYPKLLGSADIGVSLHTSSSGLDLPMKVVDMFGCQLPVCAKDFFCLHELVQNHANGLTFNSSTDLAAAIKSMLGSGFPQHQPLLQQMRANLAQKYLHSPEYRWQHSWQQHASKLFLIDA